MPFLIAVLAFLSVASGMIAVARILGEGPRSTRERLERYLGGAVGTAPPLRLGETLKTSLRRAGRIFEASDYVARLGEKLEQAGLPFRGSEFLIFDTFLTAGLAILAFALTGDPLVTFIMGIAGALGPWVVIQVHSRRRVVAFSAQLADALTTISSSLRAGYSFLQAMDVVSREMAPPLSEEFSRTLKDIRLGASTEESLSHLVGRVPSEDLDLAVTAILLQRQVGGNLSEVLDNIAYTIRERARIKGEIRILTTQARVSGLIIGLLPPAIGGVMAVINPEYMRPLFTHPLGRLMIGYAVVSEILGAMLIWKIISVKI
ncbi:MAG TPA: secretion system protein [Firmicutes bacterium]|nr:secretion system protein [Bacillota bacterium]